jgi:hypothetical protein
MRVGRPYGDRERKWPNWGPLWEQRVKGSNPSAPTIPKKGGTVGPVSYIMAGTPDDGCGTEHGLAAIRSAL